MFSQIAITCRFIQTYHDYEWILC